MDASDDLEALPPDPDLPHADPAPQQAVDEEVVRLDEATDGNPALEQY